jgi:hypothetical protein
VTGPSASAPSARRCLRSSSAWCRPAAAAAAAAAATAAAAAAAAAAGATAAGTPWIRAPPAAAAAARAVALARERRPAPAAATTAGGSRSRRSCCSAWRSCRWAPRDGQGRGGGTQLGARAARLHRPPPPATARCRPRPFPPPHLPPPARRPPQPPARRPLTRSFPSLLPSPPPLLGPILALGLRLPRLRPPGHAPRPDGRLLHRGLPLLPELDLAPPGAAVPAAGGPAAARRRRPRDGGARRRSGARRRRQERAQRAAAAWARRRQASRRAGHVTPLPLRASLTGWLCADAWAPILSPGHLFAPLPRPLHAPGPAVTPADPRNAQSPWRARQRAPCTHAARRAVAGRLLRARGTGARRRVQGVHWWARHGGCCGHAPPRRARRPLPTEGRPRRACDVRYCHHCAPTSSLSAQKSFGNGIVCVCVCPRAPGCLALAASTPSKPPPAARPPASPRRAPRAAEQRPPPSARARLCFCPSPTNPPTTPGPQTGAAQNSQAAHGRFSGSPDCTANAPEPLLPAPPCPGTGRGSLALAAIAAGCSSRRRAARRPLAGPSGAACPLGGSRAQARPSPPVAVAA